MMPQLSPVQTFFVQTPQTLVVPEPPHVSPGVVQLPQVTIPPQPSLIVPQLFGAQVFGLHVPQTLVVPEPPHVSPFAQVPQLSMCPQPSLTLPQFFPCDAHVLGTQLLQTLSTQNSPSAQLPHGTMAPVHGLVTVPQFFPWRLHSAGGEAGLQTLFTHVSVAGHPLPQVSVPPQPSEMVPHSAPTASQVMRAHAPQVLVTASQTCPPLHPGQSS